MANNFFARRSSDAWNRARKHGRGRSYFINHRFNRRFVGRGRNFVGVLSVDDDFDERDVEQRHRRSSRADCDCHRAYAWRKSAPVSRRRNVRRFVEFYDSGRLSNKHA